MARLIVVNPASASGRTGRRWRSVVAELQSHGEVFDVQVTERAGHATELARRAVGDGVRGFVVLGGDGTIGEVVAGCVAPDGRSMLADDIDLSVVHQGTGGDLARGLGIPKDEAGAIAVAVGGAPRRIDVGVARYAAAAGDETRAFVSTSNIGIGADVVERAEGRLKRLGPSASFAAATLACLARNQRRSVELTVGDDTATREDIVDIDVCNNRWMGGGMLAAPDAQLDDGAFDVVVIAAARRSRLVRTFPKIYSGAHVHDPLVRVERAATLRVDVPEGCAPQGVVLDGELVGSTPVSYWLLTRAIGVRVP